MSDRIVGEKCPTCSFEVKLVHIYDDKYEPHCSEFCASVRPEEKEAFKKLQSGEWGVFPCSRCGIPIEDEYTSGCTCGRCADLIRDERREELLKRAMAFIEEHFVLGSPKSSGLLADLKKELGT